MEAPLKDALTPTSHHAKGDSRRVYELRGSASSLHSSVRRARILGDTHERSAIADLLSVITLLIYVLHYVRGWRAKRLPVPPASLMLAGCAAWLWWSKISLEAVGSSRSSP